MFIEYWEKNKNKNEQLINLKDLDNQKVQSENEKEYEKLYVVGCSFTTGFLEKDKGSWGTYLAEKLNCKYQNGAGQSSSNYSIISQVVNMCETYDMTNSCIGIQFSERSRREMWSSDFNHYETFNISTLQINPEKNLSDNLKFVKKNIRERFIRTK